MNQGYKSIVYIFLVLLFYTCKTAYSPPAITTVTNYLVVEGFINITDSTYINLSRTVSLTAASTVKPELKAAITIEGSEGSVYALKELGKGVYAAPPLGLSAANQYHLRIKTASGVQYLSDFTDVKISPPIDTVTWTTNSTGIQVYTSTHDPANATHYYRWDYTEEWEFHSNYQSFWISDGLKISSRPLSQQIWDCFKGDSSHVITLASSINLSRDVISQKLINTIQQDEEKIGVKYSILVKQFALTKDAYDYWALLKTNTEQLGGLFDTQPSASIGNIHCLNNPAEPVIGYISAGTIATNRIFIAKSQLPNWIPTIAYPICKTDSIWLKQATPARDWQDEYLNYKSISFFGTIDLQIPIETWYFGDTLEGYISAYPYCVDCTLRGKNTPPAYWK